MPVDIATVTLRANPAYRLEPWERLEPPPGVVLPSSGGRGHPYGVLLPRSDSALPPRAVLSDVALAFLALREPGRLPAGTFGGPPGDASRTTLGLLMDGVLEAEWNGRFVSGPQACEELGLADHGTEAAGRLARLSRRALRYGAALGIVDPLQLASRLYCYNRQPAGPATARVRGAADSLGFLGLDETSAARRALERHWRLGVADEGWLTFSTRRSAPAAAQPAVKLYVSPLAETLPGILGTLQRTLARCRAVQFKVGVGAAGLNRPDKAVASFLHREDLLAAADGLRQELDGAPAHGVPFSGELGGTACSPGESPRRSRARVGQQLAPVGDQLPRGRHGHGGGRSAGVRRGRRRSGAS